MGYIRVYHRDSTKRDDVRDLLNWHGPYVYPDSVLDDVHGIPEWVELDAIAKTGAVEVTSAFHFDLLVYHDPERLFIGGTRIIEWLDYASVNLFAEDGDDAHESSFNDLLTAAIENE